MKLANILTKDGKVKLGDLGLSCYIAPGTKLKQRAGTPLYMAPEVAENNYDLRADIFSLGVCCYGLLSGTLPFTSTGMMMEPCACV